MSKPKTKAELQTELEQAYRRIAELQSADGGGGDKNRFPSASSDALDGRIDKELLEATPDAMLVVDAGGKILMANAQTEKMFGYPQSELVGAAVETLMPPLQRGGHAEHRAQFMAQPQIVTAGIERDIFAERKNGEKFPVEISLSHHKLAGGGKVILCVIRDVTERRRTRELITAQRDLARLISARNPDEFPCAFCLQVAVRVSEMDSGGIYLFDEASRTFELVHHQGLGAEFVKAVERFGEDSPNGRMSLSGRTIFFAESDLQEKDFHRAEGLRSLAIIPIEYHGQVLGCLNIASHTLTDIPDWSRSALETLAVEIGNIIIHRRTEESLKLSRAQLSQALVAARMGSWRYHIPTARVEWSPEAAKLFGIGASHDDFSAMLTRFHPEDRERLQRGLQEALAQKKVLELEYRMFDADGSIHWITNYGHVECDTDGNPLTVVGLVQDITAQKQAEAQQKEAQEDLKRERALLQLLIDNLPDFIFMKDRQSRFLVANRATARFMGADSPEQLIGKTDFDFYPQELAAQYLATEQQIMQTGKDIFEWERPQFDLAQNEQWLSGTKIALYDEQGQVSGLVGIERNITKRKWAEEAQRQSHDLLAATEKLAHIGGWEWDVERRTMTWTEETYRIHGMQPGNPAAGSPEHIDISLSCYDPSDSTVINDAFLRCIEEGESYDMEFPFTRVDGRRIWVRTKADAVKDGERVIRVVGNIQDITERRQAEQALRFSEEKWRSLFETCPTGISLANAQGEFLDANPAYMAQLGYTRAEMAKIRYQDYTPPKWHEQEAKNVAQLKASGVPMYFEKEHIRKDGTVFPVALTGWVIRDESGSPDALGVFVLDITERKQAEEKLQESQLRMEMALKGANVATWDWNVQTGKAIFNERWAEIVGYSLEELEPVSIQTWADFCHPDDLKISDMLLQKHFAGETEYYECETRMKHKNGSWVWVIDHGRVMEWDADGKPLRMFGTHLDITERKREENYTQARLNLANLSYETLDMETLMRVMLDEAEALTDSQVGFFHFVDDDQNTINLQAWSTNTLNTLCNAEGRGQHYPVAQAGVWADGIRSGESRIYNDYAGLAHRHELPEGHAPVTRLISVPIKRNNLIVAAIGVGNKPTDYNEHDLEMVKRLAEDAFDIVLRKRAEQALRESERKLSTLLSNLIGFAYRCLNDENWSMTFVSNGCMAITGYPPEDLVGNRALAYNDLIHPSDRKMVWETIQNALKAQAPFQIEYRMITRAGIEKWVWEQGRGIFEEGELKALEGFITDVTDRNRAEQALRESEERFRTVADFTYDLEYWMDENQRLVYISPSCERLTGYDRNEFIRNPALFETIVHPDDRPLYDHHRVEEFNRLDADSLDFRIITADGRERWVSHTCQSVHDRDGKPRGRRISVRDISERVKSAEKIRQQMDDLAFVNALNEAANRGESLERILEILRAEGRRIFGCRDVAVYLLSPDRQTIFMQNGSLSEPLKSRIEKLIRRPIPKLQIPVQPGGFFHKIIHSEQGMITSDPKVLQTWMEEFAETPFLPELARPGVKALIPQIFKLLGIRSVITIPLKSGNKILGALEISSADILAEQDLERLQNIRASLTEILKRKQVEQDLMASEEKYRGLMESLDSIVASVDINGVFLYMNDTAAEQLGGVPAQFIGKTMYELFPESAAHLQMRNIQTVFHADQGMVVETPSLINGKPRWYRTSIQPLHEENGQVVSVLINSTDIHQLKAMQQELQELNSTLEEKVAQRSAEVQDLYNNAPTGYHSLDASGNFVMVNQTELNWLGYTREEMIGHAARDFMTEESKNTFRENFPLFLQRGWLKDIELEFVRKDGSILPVSLNATAVRDPAGNFVMSRSTLFDITERKQAENELKRNVNFTSALLNSIPTPIFYKDREGRYLGCNRAFTELMGKTSEEIFGKQPHQIWAAEHADIYRQKDIELIQSGEIQVYESTVKDKDGKIRPVIFVKNAFLDESGKPAGLVGAFVDITERKESERILRESEETYRALFENSNDAIFLMSAADGAFVKVNPRCADLLGYPVEKLIGKNSTEFVDLLEMEDSQDRWKRIVSGERMPAYERRLVRRGGEVVETDINLSLIRDASGNPKLVQSVVRDITARKQAERALRESEEQNRLLFEESPIPVTLLHETGSIVRVNRAYEQLAGIPRSDLHGRTTEEMGLVDAPVVNSLTDAMLHSMSRQENYAIMEHPFTSADGTRRIVESRIYLLTINSVNHILVTTNDISTHKKAEETLRRANEELEHAMRMKDEFLATMSHELRTPLTGILGLSEALQMEVYGRLTEKQVKTIKTIEESGRHLLALINDVLDLSKIEAGKLTLEVSPCSLEEICQASLKLTKGMAHQKRQRVVYFNPGASILLDADSRRIKQVIVNLFSNAIKFTPEKGELGLTVEPDETNQQVRLVVWDKGIGIKPEHLPRLFQPFTQIDSSLAREYSGTGLGLALVRRLVELHDGSVTVESVFGEGSRFIVTLPWVKQAARGGVSDADGGEDPQSALADENSSLPMILITDDNPILLEMLGDFLEAKNYRTARVQSGRDLLERIESIKPDVILMDIQMPGLDGLETIRRVRDHRNAVIAATPIIAITAFAMPGDRTLCLEAGANDYISKPVTLKDLVKTLNHLTGGRS